MSDLISRDDAIRALNGACSNWEDDAKVQEIVMAIPSAKPTGDLISRADAIEAVIEYWDGYAKPLNSWDVMNQTRAVLETLPSAEATDGEWVEKGGELVCSVCGNSVSFSRTPKGWVLGRFCQTCGAKMTKGGDDE